MTETPEQLVTRLRDDLEWAQEEVEKYEGALDDAYYQLNEIEEELAQAEALLEEE